MTRLVLAAVAGVGGYGLLLTQVASLDPKASATGTGLVLIIAAVHGSRRQLQAWLDTTAPDCNRSGCCHGRLTSATSKTP